MRKLFISIVVVGIALTANAQNTEKQMATLQHGDQTSVFYGPDALISAYDAAADSADVITLSSGEFSVPSSFITKSLSIYGAGMEDDEATGTKRTRLKGTITLSHTNTTNSDGETVVDGRKADGTHLEGLFIDGDVMIHLLYNQSPFRNLEIVKCKMSSLSYYEASSYNNTIRQCVINNVQCYRQFTDNGYAYNLLLSNCHIESLSYNFRNSSTITIDHCITNGGGPYNYKNSILRSSVPSEASTSHNIFIGNTNEGVLANGNWYDLKNAGVWAAEGEDGSYAENKDFALKYPNKYVGDDGTQIGLHGGVYAWNKIPAIPRITECTIDTQDAANGTIKLSIKAEAQTKE